MIPEEVKKRNADLLKVLTPVQMHLSKMSYYGTPVSKEILFAKANYFRDRLGELYPMFTKNIGVPEFNPKSSPQLRRILFDDFGLHPILKNKKIVTDAFAMAKYAHDVGVTVKELESQNKENKDRLNKAIRAKIFFEHFREYLAVKGRMTNFIDKLLIFDECEGVEINGVFYKNIASCNLVKGKKLTRKNLSEFETIRTFEKCDKGKFGKTSDGFTKLCPACQGTGWVNPKDVNPFYIKERNGCYTLHSSFLQTAITERILASSININQIPRNDMRYNINIRNIVAARPGYKLVSYDLSKVERFMAAMLFNDDTIMKEVMEGSKAVTQFAMDAFGLGEDECGKGKIHYTAMKIGIYTSQYFGTGYSLHETLVKNDIYFPEDVCFELMDKINAKYHKYRNNARQFVWDILMKAKSEDNQEYFVRTWHGQVLPVRFPAELAVIKSWKELFHKEFREHWSLWSKRHKQPMLKEARSVFNTICKAALSFIIQGSATGMNIQTKLLQIVDEVDRMINPEWSEARYYNGDWDIARPLFPMHDSIMFEARDDVAESVGDIIIKRLSDFTDIAPLVSNPSGKKFRINVEGAIEQCWDDDRTVEEILSDPY